MTTPDARLKHKPNKRHTLEEVLKSLQDLIRNELLDEPPSARKIAAAAAAADDKRESGVAKTGLYGKPDAAMSDAPETAAERLDLPQMIESLHALIAEELATDAEPCEKEAPATDPRREVSTLAPDTLEPATETKTHDLLHHAPRPVPPEGLQEALPLFVSATAQTPAGGTPPTFDVPAAPPTRPDTLPQEAVVKKPLAPAEDIAGVNPFALEDPFSSPQGSSPPSSDIAPAPHSSEVAPKASHTDDIPVLEDIALPPPDGIPVRSFGGAPLPEPSQAHALAVRVIARLNIELRKSGERLLDSGIIKRLERLLREELEKPTQSAK